MKKTVIIIPYRDRETHLNYFLENSYPKLKTLIPDLEIIIVEQIQGRKFNRGATINIGYHYYNNLEYSYITQDVDTYPNEVSLPYYSQELNLDEFLSIYSYSGSVGGIVKFKGLDFVAINGFPNDFWGWGHEDKDFMNRILFYNKNITRVFKTDDTNVENVFFDVLQDNHKREDSGKWGVAYGSWDHLSKEQQENYILNNGLNTLNYNLIKEEQIMENVKKITVEILDKVDYLIYINGFWAEFDENDFSFFKNIFKKTKLSNCKITKNINEANVLFESIFSKSLVNYKKWIYKIHYSGEPFSNNSINYDLVLDSKKTNLNNVDLPLFVYYTHFHNFFDKLVNKPLVTKIPKHFCCFIVSNGNCNIRNKMFELLNKYKKVHSYGKYQNNMGFNLTFSYSTDEFRKILSNYKFIICFENAKLDTYSTEKIVNPYLSGTIPIYWSSHHIKNIFNPESMLFLEDESETSFQNLINKIIELDNSDEKYLEFANRPVFKSMDYWNNNYTIDKIAKNINLVLN
jgi:beta-1,4-galactosyltransferase 1